MLYAHQANAAAQSLAAVMRHNGIEPLYPVEANTVFVQLPPVAAAYLRNRGWHFYDFIGGASRFMCSYRVTTEIIAEFGRDLHAAMESAGLSAPETIYSGLNGRANL
jgi:threonine aldolase